MATIQEVTDDFAHYKADVSAKLQGFSAQIADLQAQVGAGKTLEASDLDTIKTAIDAADAELNPPV